MASWTLTRFGARTTSCPLFLPTLFFSASRPEPTGTKGSPRLTLQSLTTSCVFHLYKANWLRSQPPPSITFRVPMASADAAQPSPSPSLSLDSLPTTPRGRAASSGPAFGFGSSHSPSPSPLSLSRFSSSRGAPDSCGGWWRTSLPRLRSLLGSRGGDRRVRRKRVVGGGGVGAAAGSKGWHRRRTRGIVIWGGVVVFFFLMNWWMFSRLQDTPIRLLRRNPGSSNVSVVSLSRPSILVPFFFLHSYIYLAESFANVINGHYWKVS